MNFMINKNVSIFTWDKQILRAIQYKRSGDQLSILQSVDVELNESTFLEAYLNLESTFKLDNNSTIVIAGNYNDFVYLDMAIPIMKQSDCHGAIKFALQGKALLNNNDISYIYRRIDPQTIQVAYTRSEIYDTYLNFARQIKCGVDAIIPFPLAISPVSSHIAIPLNESTSFIAETHGNHFDYSKHGQAIIRPAFLSDTADINEALISSSYIARYVTSSAYLSERMGLALPSSLRPKRFNTIKFLIAVAAMYTFVALGVSFYRSNNAQNNYKDKLIAEHEKLLEIKSTAAQTQINNQITDGLLQEVNELRHQPRMSQALADLSKLVDKRLWMSRYTWEQSRLTMEFRTTKDFQGAFQPLSESKHFEAVKFNRRKNANSDLVTYRVTCRYVGKLPGGSE